MVVETEQPTLILPGQETPKRRVSADKWIASDMVFVTDGEGYGIATNGDTVCIGCQKNIQDYLDGGDMPHSIRGRSRQMLIEIKEFLKELEDVRGNTGESFRAVEVCNQRSRPAKSFKRRNTNAKSTTAEKRLPGSKVRH